VRRLETLILQFKTFARLVTLSQNGVSNDIYIYFCKIQIILDDVYRCK
jgi:hypothetical protein